MKVRELIEALNDCDPEASVLIMSQPHWPFEYALAHVAVRRDFEESAEDDNDEERRPARDSEGRSASDVFIVEGSQLRYGSANAWNR